jgi:hypothetical protein
MLWGRKKEEKGGRKRGKEKREEEKEERGRRREGRDRRLDITPGIGQTGHSMNCNKY